MFSGIETKSARPRLCSQKPNAGPARGNADAFHTDNDIDCICSATTAGALKHEHGMPGIPTISSILHASEIHTFASITTDISFDIANMSGSRGRDIRFDGLVISKYTAGESPKLAEAALKGKIYPKVQIVSLTLKGNARNPIWEIEIRKNGSPSGRIEMSWTFQ